MNLGISQSTKDAPTTKEELISRLSKRLAEEEGSAAWCRKKKETGNAFLGDLESEIARHEAAAAATKYALDKLLS